METDSHYGYDLPEVDIVYVGSEQGFAASLITDGDAENAVWE